MFVDSLHNAVQVTERARTQTGARGDNRPRQGQEQAFNTTPRFSSVPLQAHKAYNSVRFGSGQTFDLSKLLNEQVSGHFKNDIWESAQRNAKGEELTPEDLLLAYIDSFNEDMAEYKKALEAGKPYDVFSYLGESLNLKSLFSDAKKLEQTTTELSDTREQLVTYLASKPQRANLKNAPQPNTDLSKVLELSQQVYDKSRQLGVNPARRLNRVTPELILQLIATKDTGLAGKLTSQLFENLRIKPKLDLSLYLENTTRKGSIQATDAANGINLSEIVKDNAFIPYPLSTHQVDKVLNLLDRASRNVYLTLPPGGEPNQVIEALAFYAYQRGKFVEQKASQTSENPDKATANGSSVPTLPTSKKQPTFIQIDFLAFANTIDKPQDAVPKFIEKVKDLAHQHDRVVLHVKNLERVLRSNPKRTVDELIQQLNLKGKVQLILTPDLSDFKESRMMMPNAPQYKLADQLAEFARVPIMKPPVEDVLEYINKHHLADVQKQFPDMAIGQDAVEQAIKMAFRSGEPVIKTTLDYLKIAAESAKSNGLATHAEKAPLLPAALKQAVIDDPYADYIRKSAKAGMYQVLDVEDLDDALKDKPRIVGVHDATQFFKQLALSINQREQITKLGLLPKTRGLIVGGPGTGKTDLVLQFAQQQRIPVIYISGKDLKDMTEPKRIEAIVEQAFAEARDEVERSQKPAVLMVLDNLEAAFIKPDPEEVTSQEDSFPYLNRAMAEIQKLQKEDNTKIVPLAITNNGELAGGVLQFWPDLFNQEDENIVVVRPPDFAEERAQLFKSIAESLEKEAGQTLFEKNIDFASVVLGSGGITGRDVYVILRKAIENAYTNNPKNISITADDVDRAIKDLTLGKENRLFGRYIPGQELRKTTYHELGHAIGRSVMNRILEHPGSEVDDITIIPQGQALGVTFSKEKQESFSQDNVDYLINLVSAMGSTGAENVILQMSGQGRSGDLIGATQIARLMVGQLGMTKGNYLVYDHQAPLPPELEEKANALVAISAQIGAVIITNYRDFIEDVAITLCGEDGKSGKERMTGKEFIERLDAFEKQHPDVVSQTKKDILNIIVKNQLLPERYRKKYWVWGPVVRIQSPYPEIERQQRENKQPIKPFVTTDQSANTKGRQEG